MCLYLVQSFASGGLSHWLNTMRFTTVLLPGGILVLLSPTSVAVLHSIAEGAIMQLALSKICALSKFPQRLWAAYGEISNGQEDAWTLERINEAGDQALCRHRNLLLPTTTRTSNGRKLDVNNGLCKETVDTQ